MTDKKTTCRLCGREFKNRREWFEHNKLVHKQEQLKDYPWLPGPSPFDTSEKSSDLLAYTEYMVNKNEILEADRDISAVFSTYNFPMVHLTDADIERQMWEIYRKQDRSYKLNLSPGYILETTKSDSDGNTLPSDSQSFRYFSPGGNNHVMEDPVVIKNVSDLERAIAKIQAINILEYIKKPGSNYILRFFCQLKYYVYKLPRALGADTQHILPYYIRRNEKIFTQSDVGVKKSKNHNLCLFTCIAQAEKYKQCQKIEQLRNVHKRAVVLYQKFASYALQTGILAKTELELHNFKGIRREHITHVETSLDVSLNIMSINEAGEAHTCFTSSVRKSSALVLFMNEYNDHLNLILDVDAYCNYYCCKICDRMFKTKANMERHSRVCTQKTRHIFPGNFKKQHKNIFERLQEVGIHVTDRVHEFFAVWDLEARLPRSETQPFSDNLKYTARHVANCAAVCSNVPGFDQPKVIIEADEQVVVDKMLAWLTQIREKAASLTYLRWGWVLERLDELISERERDVANSALSLLAQNELEEALQDELDYTYETAEQNEPAPSEGAKSKRERDVYLSLLLKYRAEMVRFMSQLIVISFAGSAYDYNLVRAQIAHRFVQEWKLEKHEESSMEEVDLHKLRDDIVKGLTSRTGETYVIKRANRHICISNLKFKLLDITSYLSVGVTYKQFVDMFGTSTTKYHAFPYEWWQTFEQLEQTQLPPYPSSHWFSSLRQTDLLHAEFASWEAAKNPDLPRPLTGVEKFNEIKTHWVEEGWTSMRCFLTKYCSFDVLPFCEAIISFAQIWHKENVNVFQETVSLPGLSNVLLWRDCIREGHAFPLFPEKDKDLFYCMRKNIAAGQSLVVNRHQELGLTKLNKDSQDITRGIWGVDAGSLYGGCMGMDIPINSYVRRFAHSQFKPQPMARNHMMYIWLRHVQERDNVHIISKQSHGSEVRIAQYSCDGFSTYWCDVQQKQVYKVYEFMGCYWHAHSDPDNPCPLKPSSGKHWPLERYSAALAKIEFIRSAGFQLEVIWECSFLKMVEENVELRSSVDMFKPEFYAKHPGTVKESKLLEAIAEDKLFGLVLVNVYLLEEYKHLYDQFPILFTNMNLEMKDLCPNTRQYIIDNDLHFKSKRMLMSENNAENILISSEYLAWILERKHFKVEVLEVTEFCRAKVFNKFVHFVAEQRHAATTNPDLKLFANTYKVLLCASYGMMLLNKSKFEQTKYLQGSENVRNAVNDEKFRRLTFLGEESYEISMAPKRIIMDSPIPVGCIILSRAKTVMLRFLYSFLFSYILPKHCSLLYHDTDSFYLSSSFPTLTQAVRDEKKEEFHNMMYNRCGERLSFDRLTFYFPRQCCEPCTVRDQLTPFIFKEEYCGDLFLAVSSKTYLARCGDQYKISSKGVSVQDLKKNQPESIFRNVLTNKSSYRTVNRGFRVIRDGIVSYSQQKLAFSFLYLKRGLHPEPNSSFTYALGLTLDPAPRKYTCIQIDKPALSLDHHFRFEHMQKFFLTVRQAITYYSALQQNNSEVCRKSLTTVCEKPLTKMYSECTANLKPLINEYTLRDCLLSKFKACPLTQCELKSCNSEPFNVETNKYLGIGERMEVARWLDPQHFGGQNKVGKWWMKIAKSEFETHTDNETQ